MVVLCGASAAAAQDADDPHIRLRIEAGLSAASAEGPVRLYTIAVYLMFQDSIVANRDAQGRWTVSRVERGAYVRTPSRIRVTTRRLSRKSAATLEKLLDDRALYQGARADHGPCLDPVDIYLDLTWKGRAVGSSSSCGANPTIEALHELLDR